MKPFDGFRSEAATTKTEQLPAGVYVAQVKAVKIDGEEPDQSLIIRVDISEGPYAGYYTKRFKRESENDSSRFPARYKGDYRLRIPNDDNKRAMYPESDKRRFNDAMFKFAKSNPGYEWDWNERGLVGKTIGINVRQGTYNGAEFTRIGRLEVADDVRRGIVQVMAPMAPKSDASYDPPIDAQTGFVQVNTEDVPF